jgi:hypothetical protein
VRLLRPDGVQLISQASHSVEVGGVINASGSVLQGEFTHLALEPGAIHRDRAFPCREHGDDLCPHAVVELD